MAGLAVKIDENLREQFEAIVEAKLLEFGLIEKEPKVSREEATRMYLEMRERSLASGRSPLSHDEVFDRVIARIDAKAAQARK